MSSEREKRETDPIRRILVALDAASASLANLDRIASLAARFRAELEAVLVEDEELLRCADYPRLRQVALHTGRTEKITRRRLERQLRSIAQQTRDVVEAVSEVHRVRSTFRVVRGSVLREVVSASSNVDLVVVEGVSRSFMSHGTLTSRLGPAADHVGRSILLLHADLVVRGRVVAVLSDPVLTSKVLDLARPFLGYADELDVVLAAGRFETRRSMRDQTVAWLRRRSLQAVFHLLPAPGPHRLTRALRAIGAGLVVLSADVVETAGGTEVLTALKIPVVLVR